MKPSTQLWIRQLSKRYISKFEKSQSSDQLFECAAFFMEELYSSVAECVSYFNHILKIYEPELQMSLLPMSHPRQGLIVLRGGDKLVILPTGCHINLRFERSSVQKVGKSDGPARHSLTFIPEKTPLGVTHWTCVEDSSWVNPELVIQRYIGVFFVHGHPGANLGAPQPRLVAVSQLRA